MKRYILTVFTFILSLVSFGQEGFGIMIGAQQHTFSTKYRSQINNDFEKSKHTTLNYTAGIVVRTKLGNENRFSSLVEVAYSTFNTKLSDFRDKTNSIQVLLGNQEAEESDYESKFSAINTKFLGGVKLFNNFYVEFGPELNYILGNDELIYSEDNSISNFQNKTLRDGASFNKFRVLGVGGMFYEINNSLGIGVRYHQEILFWKKTNHPTVDQEFLGKKNTKVDANYLSVNLLWFI